MASLPIYIILGATLFALGVIGFLVRRNMIIMFLCTELMFQGVILNLIGYSGLMTSRTAALRGQVFAVFLIVVAAAEAAMALGLVVLLFRRKPTLDAESWTALWG
jgi:NADH-quinone oxidoreductase subunit K